MQQKLINLIAQLSEREQEILYKDIKFKSFGMDYQEPNKDLIVCDKSELCPNCEFKMEIKKDKK